MKALLASALVVSLFAVSTAFARDPDFEGVHLRAQMTLGLGSTWAPSQDDNERGTDGTTLGFGLRGTLKGLWLPHSALPLVTDGELQIDGNALGGFAARGTLRAASTLTSADRGLGIGGGLIATGEFRISSDMWDGRDNTDKTTELPSTKGTSRGAAYALGAGPALTYLKRNVAVIVQPWLGYGSIDMRHDWNRVVDGEPETGERIRASRSVTGIQGGARAKVEFARGADLYLTYRQSSHGFDLSANATLRISKDLPVYGTLSGGGQHLGGKIYATDVLDRKESELNYGWCTLGAGGTW